ncbi:response regulator transcription factor [Thalassobaculum sp.]|uniref:response regulator transcription factor n=1 Tax=Thalassobaculum sp. TaxID=2022740 RepID=UPI0032F06E59
MSSPIQLTNFTTDRSDGSETRRDERLRVRLLLVDDDELFREALAGNLMDEQFEVVTCENGKAGLDVLIEDQQFDLILLDWRMPELSGIEVLQQIKAAGIEIPVVYLTAFATERNEENALDCGAVDFLDKSRSPAVLARRIRILVGNGRGGVAETGEPPEALRVGPLDIHFRVNRAYWSGQLVPLTATEFRVVQLLASRIDEDVTYRAIYDVVHGRGFVAGDGADGYRTNVRSLIRRVRQKFHEIDPAFEEIENYPGFGYRWRSPLAAPLDAERTPGALAAASVERSVGDWQSLSKGSRVTREPGSRLLNGTAGIVPLTLQGADVAPGGPARGEPRHDHSGDAGDTT